MTEHVRISLGLILSTTWNCSHTRAGLATATWHTMPMSILTTGPWLTLSRGHTPQTTGEMPQCSLALATCTQADRPNQQWPSEKPIRCWLYLVQGLFPWPWPVLFFGLLPCLFETGRQFHHRDKWHGTQESRCIDLDVQNLTVVFVTCTNKRYYKCQFEKFVFGITIKSTWSPFFIDTKYGISWKIKEDVNIVV